MANTYTFFKKKKLTWDVLIYEGELDTQPKAEANDSLSYYIELDRRHFQLWKSNSGAARSLLSGSFKGLLRYSAVITGDDVYASAKRNGVFTSGWTFVYMANKYRWHVSPLSRGWSLKDNSGRVIAMFERASLRIAKIGILRILEAACDEKFKELILLTCEMVHRTVKAKQRHAGGGG